MKYLCTFTMYLIIPEIRNVEKDEARSNSKTESLRNLKIPEDYPLLNSGKKSPILD